MNWQNMKIQEILTRFETQINYGLSREKIMKNLNKYGKNKLEEKKPESLVKRFLAQFSDFMIIILLIAAAVSFFTSLINGQHDYIDSIIILGIIIVNAIVGLVQETKAEKAIDALKKLSSPMAKVKRGGISMKIATEDVIPGDILVLHTGDMVPADARLLETYNLKVEESALTGESLPISKNANLTLNKNIAIADMKNMVFSTSIITAGRGEAVVVATGMNTQVGKIASMISEQETPQTPLQLKLEKMSKILGIGALAACFVIFLLGIFQSIPILEMFMVAISLAVAAIPEGLPAVVTIVMAIGVRRMVSRNAIIRKLPAVETLGNANIICSDKTGTLTQNKMTVTTICSETGKINFNSTKGQEILELASLCNNSKIVKESDKLKVLGDPTETSIINALLKLKKDKNSLENKFPRVFEFPFDAKRKLMTTVHKLSNGRYRVITKGAPDFFLEKSSSCQNLNITAQIKRDIKLQIEQMAYDALRVLAVGYKDMDFIPESHETAEKNLNFIGLIGMIDPPRPQAKFAVKECLEAGIKPVMITGDHILTAKAIARELNILTANSKAMSGEELDKMTQKDLEKEIFSYSVFARVSPEHKVRIVKAFQKRGKIVAMTGDGVNDAPALKAADIGCAMGITGTDVAKGAADIILTDDNFSTIVEAVRQGRGIFANIQKTVHFLLSSNIGEIVCVLTSFLLRFPTPLLAIQLLWVNLVTDSFPALALGVEPVEEDIMKKKPIKANSSLFSVSLWRRIALESTYLGAISLLAFVIGYFFDSTNDPIIARTMAFTVLSMSKLVHVFNVRSEKSIFKNNLFSNLKLIYAFILCVFLQLCVVCLPTFMPIFKTTTLPLQAWLIIIVLSLSPIILVEIEKYISRRRRQKEKLEIQNLKTSQNL